MKDGFVYKRWWRDVLLAYPEQVREEVNNAIIAYGLLEELISLKTQAWAAFKAIKEDIDHDRQDEARRMARSRRMREVVRRRWDKNKNTPAQDDNSENQDVNTYVYTHVNTYVYTSENAPGGTLTPEEAGKTAENPRACAIGSLDINSLSPYRQQEENIKKEKVIKEKESQKKKAATALRQPSAATALEARTQEFYLSLVPYVDTYGRDMVRRFFDYWTEPNKSRTKMRWELERTFEVRRRLATWASRDKTFTTQHENSRTDHQATQQQRVSDALDIMRRLDAEGHADPP